MIQLYTPVYARIRWHTNYTNDTEAEAEAEAETEAEAEKYKGFFQV